MKQTYVDKNFLCHVYSGLLYACTAIVKMLEISTACVVHAIPGYQKNINESANRLRSHDLTRQNSRLRTNYEEDVHAAR